ncbi:hypothetical protein FI667_g5817, partial [Globisporangium splendens]
MRTKEQEQLEAQEAQWIYLLHDQAPPSNQRHVTPAVLAARAAGTMGDVAPSHHHHYQQHQHQQHHQLLPSVSASAGMFVAPPTGTSNGPYLYRSQGPPGQYQGGYDGYSRASPSGYPSQQQFTEYAPRGREYIMKQPVQRAIGSVVSVHDKWQIQQPPTPVAVVASAFPPLRSMLSKQEKPQMPPQHIVPGPMVMKSHQPVAAPVRVDRRVQGPHQPQAGLLDLLPKKRRHEEVDEEYKAPAGNKQDEDEEEFDENGNKLSKRNCFPKKCDFPMCKNSSRSRGFCYSHGGGRRCRMDGCNNGAVSRDLCKRHGGGRRCRINGCKSSSESGGLCYSHGGGRRCNLSWCSARAKKGGFCAVHVGNENAEPPTAEEAAVASASEAVASEKSESVTSAKNGAAVHPNVVETLLSLAQAKSSKSSSSASERRVASSSFSSTGSTSPTSPASLSTPRYSSIASILN